MSKKFSRYSYTLCLIMNINTWELMIFVCVFSRVGQQSERFLEDTHNCYFVSQGFRRKPLSQKEWSRNLTADKAGNGWVQGNQQKTGENKSQPLPALGVKDRRSNGDQHWGWSWQRNWPTQWCWPGERSSGACRGQGEEVRDQAMQSTS